jgi:hypothetical protein
VQDAADHAAVVHALLAAHIRRKIGLDPPPLRVIQPKKIATHPIASESRNNGITNRFNRQCFY